MIKPVERDSMPEKEQTAIHRTMLSIWITNTINLNDRAHPKMLFCTTGETFVGDVFIIILISKIGSQVVHLRKYRSRVHISPTQITPQKSVTLAEMLSRWLPICVRFNNLMGKSYGVFPVRGISWHPIPCLLCICAIWISIPVTFYP